MLCGALLVSLPGPAVGEVVRHRDPAGDVARSPVGTNAYAPAPDQVRGDIVAAKVRFARRAVWIRYRLRDLTTTGNGNFHLIGLRSDRRERTIELDAFPEHWEGGAVVTNTRAETVGCPVSHRIDYDRNRVGLRVPWSCLGKATWVRVGIRTTVAGTTHAYVDDARAAGYSSSLVYGRRVHREP
jgi:hypothetical protein